MTAWQFQKPARREPEGTLIVHLWHRCADPTRVQELKDTMAAHLPFRQAQLVVHEDGEQLPGCVVLEGDGSWRFDLPTFRLMCHDIL
jgi:hypothetical protein